LPPGAVIYTMGSDDQSASTLLVNVAALDANAVTLDALARVQLTARRCGFSVQLRDTSPELRELIGFAGLDAVLPEEPLGLEPGR
jgi:hypothetical protein